MTSQNNQNKLPKETQNHFEKRFWMQNRILVHGGLIISLNIVI